MALDTFQTIWSAIKARCPEAGPLLCQDWVKNAFRQVAERRRWSWLIKQGQFVAPAQYNTGTANVTNGSTIVTGNGTTWTQSMVGTQFRTGINSPIYTITQWDSATQIELDLVWGGPTAASVGYRIYQCYFPAPNDFFSFVSVWDPNFAYQLNLDIQQATLNQWDPQRANTGQAYVVASRDYSSSSVGTVGPLVQALGSGPAPVGGGQYTGANDALFTIQVTTGGVTGTAQFQWKKDSGTFTTAVVTDSNPQLLIEGVTVYWPLAQTFVLNDTFILRTYAINSVGLPRYEIWPHQAAAYVYPFLYEMRIPDLSDPGATLPRYIRGDVLLEMALAEAAKWPGPSVSNPNVYFNLGLADRHEKRSERMIMELERQDDEIFQMDAMYPQTTWPYAPMLGDSAWVQSHAV